MTESIVTRYRTFNRVELPEDAYEKLLLDLAPRIFPDAFWFEFKPPIKSPHGAAHPDALLVRKDASEWWVVEVELARHSVRDHVELQLRKLRDGWYTADAMKYVTGRSPDAGPLISRVNLRSPQFLLLLDDVSGPLESAARQLDFDVIHAFPFVSGDHMNVVAVQEHHASRKSPREASVMLTARPGTGCMVFSLARPDGCLPSLPNGVFLGARFVKTFASKDGRSFAAALSHSELMSTLGAADHFLLTPERGGSIRITAVPATGRD